MKYSFSRVNSYEPCPYAWKLCYIDKVQSWQDIEAFQVGHAMHKGIECQSIEAGIEELKKEAGVWSDKWETEAMKLQYLLPKILPSLDKYKERAHEIKIGDDKEFVGYIDMIADGDLYDFKYCAESTAKNLNGRQLSIYKDLAKKYNDIEVNKLFYVIIPKVNIKQRKNETIHQFRNRLEEHLKGVEIRKIEVDYDPNAIVWFYDTIKKIEADKVFEKKEDERCRLCPYRVHCQESEVEQMEEKKEEKVEAKSILPKAERKDRAKNSKLKIWIYGAPFSGKTTFANLAPMPLFLNTDGNVKFIDAPAIPIKDGTVKIEGSRMNKKVWGWSEFKKVIEELETNTGGYETLVVDLIEDVYEMCRNYVYAQRGWEHESDDPFKAYDIIRKEFLDAMKRLCGLDLNIILLSHEGEVRDITKASGKQVSLIKPNILDKLAKKLAGMVDIVARLIVRDGAHVLTFSQKEDVFGGGRIKLNRVDLPVDEKTGFEQFTKLMKGE